MGLVISHGAYEGGYIRFNLFRTGILKAIGGSFPPHENPYLDAEKWYWREDGDVDETFNKTKYAGLYEFICHSDCDGYISLVKVRLLKIELESILPIIENYAKSNNNDELIERTHTLIEGCKCAMNASEPLEFW